jgi:hypothetical protein
MRSFWFVLASNLLAVPQTAMAAEPDTGLAFFTAAALDTGGFIVGGALVGTSPAGGVGDGQRSFGWLAIQAGATLSPLIAHGLVGEWDRGAAFAAIPAGALAGTAALYRGRTDGVEYSNVTEQWLVWGFFSASIAASVAGAADVLFAGSRLRGQGVALYPIVGPGQAALEVGGLL